MASAAAVVEGQKLWLGQGDAWVQFYGMKAAEMATIVNQVYGPNVDQMVKSCFSTSFFVLTFIGTRGFSNFPAERVFK